MNIYMTDENNRLTEEQRQLVESILIYTAEQEEVDPNSELSVTFVSNDEIQEINREWRGKDQATDVISFAMEELGEDEIDFGLLEDEPVVLGDLIISVERCREQAAEYGNHFERELGFLAVHGFLHLLGYDHIEKADEEIMTKRQEEILHHFELFRGTL
ncbi:rRNA maturation RNase YbeY [Exiguobacterium acetylicum]|uniref:rRNA maturation RNase YbeY n=1 Tax=Exiguobacterium TaxID=33986 RepID=UPI0007014739|nr:MULTISPECIES: rRNA maturation RNase YbeY [Exiguobacterium]KQS44699.1 rRNA maturation factor [Exiguobacterium sp. Leaf196]MDQ6466009.1 rRNA maturation RNase YbeY [Exiguobacterium acetylicum]MDT0171504.1 rRNA maturation RNase YbeY [Exiguobacterium sp. BRG2]HAL00945.1 rRNA maturation RNase YbeY [Exiguobacterium sp.]HBF58062.1 rRNA maturation RNase YbeY [Exiguobacterium sp.]